MTEIDHTTGACCPCRDGVCADRCGCTRCPSGDPHEAVILLDATNDNMLTITLAQSDLAQACAALHVVSKLVPNYAQVCGRVLAAIDQAIVRSVQEEVARAPGGGGVIPPATGGECPEAVDR
ncbi:MAG TPA: hypothetical protein VF163_02475 [Micromonosporaceae bacterium]